MKITELEVLQMATDSGRNWNWTFVKIRTDANIHGYGESSLQCKDHALKAELEDMGRFLLGKDPFGIEGIWNSLHRCVTWTGGPVTMSAISGIETALWDIAGQAAGLPIYRLLGGKFRDRIRLYNDCHAGDEETPEAYAQCAREVEAQGFDAIKFDIDPLPTRRDPYNRAISNDDLAHYVDVVRAVREALDHNTDLAIDAHWAYVPADILKVARAFEDLELLWLEDPIPPENVAALAELKRATRTPICTGENFYTRFGFRELIQSQAADIVSPDLAKAGGLLEGRRIADLADMYYVNIAPHNIGSPIETVATCHVCAAVPNFLALEFHHLGVDLWNDLVNEGPLIVDGQIALSDRPGLGVTVNEDAVQRAAKEDLGFL